MKSLKKILYVFLALVICTATFFVEKSISKSEELEGQHQILVSVPAGEKIELTSGIPKELIGPREFFLQPHQTVSTLDAESVEMRFSDRGVIRLGAQTQLTFAALDNANDGYSFQLLKGRVWANTLFTSATLNLVAGSSFVIPQQGVLDMRFDQEKSIIYANRHHLTVGLIPSGYIVGPVIRFPTVDFINSFLLAQGSQTTVFTDKVDSNQDTLRQILYSKLIKEFQVALVNSALLKQDQWFKSNVDLDNELSQNIATRVLRLIRDRGLRVANFDSFNYQLSQAAGRFSNALTFFKERKVSRLSDDLFNYLNDAEYLLVFGRAIEAKERLDRFVSLTKEYLGGQGGPFKYNLISRLDSEYLSLGFVTPTEPLFMAKSAIGNILITQIGHSDQEIRKKFLITRDFINDAYNLANTNVQSARDALEQYFNHLMEIISQEKVRLVHMKNLVAQESQIMDNLFRQFPEFYRDRFFGMKSRIEEEWLALLPEGDDKNEEKQTIISNKIDFLRQLKTFFLADKIMIDDAKQIIFRLFREVDDLQLPADAQVAVSELFAKRLEDFGVFFRFLNTPEYVSTDLHGVSYQARFDQFVRAQQEQVSINEIRKEILGEKETAVVTIETILDQARKDLENTQITDLQFGSFDQSAERFIPVTRAVLNGITFQAQYDWDKKMFSQIVVDSTAIGQGSVRLGNLALVLKSSQPASQQVSSEVTQEATAVPSKIERVAKILLLQKLKSKQIITTEAKIEIVNLSDSSFAIHDATLVANQSVHFSFNFAGKENNVSLLKVVTQHGDRSHEVSLALDDLAKEVLDLYQKPADSPF